MWQVAHVDFSSAIFFWLIFYGNVASKLQKCAILVSRELRARDGKSLLRTLPASQLRQTAECKYFQSFVKSCLQSLCVCVSLPWHWIFEINRTVCLKPSTACVPAKNQDLAVGFLPKCSTKLNHYVQTHNRERVQESHHRERTAA